MLAFSNDYYGIIFRATQSVELFCAYLKMTLVKCEWFDLYIVFLKYALKMVLVKGEWFDVYLNGVMNYTMNWSELILKQQLWISTQHKCHYTMECKVIYQYI